MEQRTAVDSEESSTNISKTQNSVIDSEARVGANSPGPSEKDIETANNDIGNATQAGVQNIEAVSMTWTTWSLIIAYIGVFLISFTTSLESQVVMSLSVFATSSFNNHSLISTVLVVQSVVMAVIKAPMAKTADVFGRLEAFTISIILAIIGGATMAISNDVQTYAAAQIFYAAGSTGLQILQQIFIADTTNLLNRALWSSLPQIPFLITVWIGAPIGDKILKTTTWRWGYGIWCIILPVVFLPLALSLFLNNRKAKKAGLTAPSPLKKLGPIAIITTLWNDLDIGGMILLSAAFALILIPLTIASKASKGWASPDIIAMIVLGVICFISFPVWESVKTLAPHPLVPLGLLKSRTFCAGCGIGFFYFRSLYPAAGHVTQVFSFTATISSVIISFFIKYTKYYKPYITAGALIYLMGIGLMFHYRRENSSIAQIIGTQIAVGIGGGMLNVPAQLAVQASVPSHQNVAVATAVYLTCVEMGGAVGSAISGVIWGQDIPKKLAQYSSTIDSKAVYNSITNALAYPMGTPERIAINRAYQETMQKLLIVALCVSAPIVLLSLVIKNAKLDAGEDKVKGRVIGGRVERKEEAALV
ncbi:major facilitator superfamily transporter [Botrytis cinerea]